MGGDAPRATILMDAFGSAMFHVKHCFSREEVWGHGGVLGVVVEVGLRSSKEDLRGPTINSCFFKNEALPLAQKGLFPFHRQWIVLSPYAN